MHDLLTRRRQRLLLIEVPEEEQVGDRFHLDLGPAEGTRDEELARLRDLAARRPADLRTPDGSGGVVLAGPEGDVLRILRRDAERASG